MNPGRVPSAAGYNVLQWNLFIKDTLNRGQLSNEGTVCSPNHMEGLLWTKLNIRKYLLIASIYIDKVEVTLLYITYCLHWLLLFTSACSVAPGQRWGSTATT